jgi:hypothetical protein
MTSTITTTTIILTTIGFLSIFHHTFKYFQRNNSNNNKDLPSTILNNILTTGATEKIKPPDPLFLQQAFQGTSIALLLMLGEKYRLLDELLDKPEEHWISLNEFVQRISLPENFLKQWIELAIHFQIIEQQQQNQFLIRLTLSSRTHLLNSAYRGLIQLNISLLISSSIVDDVILLSLPSSDDRTINNILMEEEITPMEKLFENGYYNILLKIFVRPLDFEEFLRERIPEDYFTRLRNNDIHIADLWCQNGQSTLALSFIFPHAYIYGYEISSRKLTQARDFAHRVLEEGKRVKFFDVRERNLSFGPSLSSHWPSRSPSNNNNNPNHSPLSTSSGSSSTFTHRVMQSKKFNLIISFLPWGGSGQQHYNIFDPIRLNEIYQSLDVNVGIFVLVHFRGIDKVLTSSPQLQLNKFIRDFHLLSLLLSNSSASSSKSQSMVDDDGVSCILQKKFSRVQKMKPYESLAYHGIILDTWCCFV